MLELTIPAIAPSLNKMLRMHWRRRGEVMDKWRTWIWAARCQKVTGPLIAPNRAKVTIERVSPWPLDEDNLYGSAKFLCDSLRANNLIFDDSPKHIQLTVTQSKGPKQTVIRIEPLE